MRRRDALAGIASLGVLASGSVIAVRGLPSVDDQLEDGENDTKKVEQMTIETADARGSDAGELEVPATTQPTFLDFFGTWCPPCIEQMPALAAAHERIGDEVLFVSVTTEAVGQSITEDELADWWAEHDGNWTIGLDPTVELADRYNPSLQFPKAVAIDEQGEVQWSDSGVKTADELVNGIEHALELSPNPDDK